MHIVFVTTELATKDNSSGGLASYVANMSRVFVRKGHKVTIIWVTTKDIEITFDPEIEVINVFVEKKHWEEISNVAELCLYSPQRNKKMYGFKSILMNIYKSKLTYEKILNLHKSSPIDIIQVTNLGFLSCQFDNVIPFVVRMSSFLNMCDEANKRVVDQEYGLYKMSLYNKAHLNVIKETRYVISPSYFLKEISEKEYGFSPDVLESPFILDTTDWKLDLYNKYLDGKKYLLHFGSLKYLKGIHVVAEIAEKFLKNYPDKYLVLAGCDSNLQLENGQEIVASEWVKKNAGVYSDRVIYVGRPVREELYPIINSAEVCLLPSRIENLSNACIEALAMGKIVIATNGASYEQLIINHFNGFLCERDNAESFYQGIEEAFHLSNEEKNEISNRAKKTVERLEPDNIYETYMKYYKKVITEWYDSREKFDDEY